MTPGQNAFYERFLSSDETVANLDLATTYKRHIWRLLDNHLNDFLDNGSKRWLLLPGIRGIGKTTLLTQLYNNPKIANYQKIFLSLDKFNLMDVSMNDFVEAVSVWKRSLKHPVLIFLDEVHFAPKWSVACKVIFDQTPNLFMVCTGSSALGLSLSPDNARRADVIDVHPLNFIESVALEQNYRLKPPSFIPQLTRVLFASGQGREVYQGLINYQTKIKAYYKESQLSDQLIDNYINGYSSLPFKVQSKPQDSSLFANNQVKLDLKKDKVLRIIRQTVTDDITSQIGPNFNTKLDALNDLYKLILVLANSSQISLRSMAARLQVDIKTLKIMLRALSLTKLIIEVLPLKSSFGHTTRTPKYLFASPALRRALTNTPTAGYFGDYDSHLKGRLLEDAVIMYLERISSSKIIEYDSSKSGADFIVSETGLMKDAVVLEVGYNKKTSRQIRKTMEQAGRYGLVITDCQQPKIDKDERVVYVPLNSFLLL